MVGEIRDLETCEIAMRAGLTGHCVLTTIHSGNTTEVLTRLLDMGVEPFIVSSAVTGSLAQRLVRKVCQSCKAPAEPPAHLVRMLSETFDLSGFAFVAGRGCPTCDGTGYHGRTLITELMRMNDDLRRAIIEKRSGNELRDALRRAGSSTLVEDGLAKVKAGVTTLDEVFRVLGSTSGGY
jgi:type IV pilus assembly protein PilB